MKNLVLLLLTVSSFASFGQKVITTEEIITFNNGSKNAIVVTIPNGKSDVVIEKLKKELKDWGGKVDESKGEFASIGCTIKTMGDKPFDTYARLIQQGDLLKVAFAVDLGGAFMNSKDHNEQYRIIMEKAKKFAETAGAATIAGDLKAENKVLKSLIKEKTGVEKAIEKSQSNIEKMKKSIADEEKKIENAKSELEKKKSAVQTQEEKIREIEKKK